MRKDESWMEVVPGIDSVVVRFDATATDATSARQRIAACIAGGVPALPCSEELLEIPVVYGGQCGPDLVDVCRELEISSDDFIALHTGSTYTVDMVGFTPGFAFVGGLDKRLSVPRLERPRQRVAAGSIGIADGRTGMYALASPGGWALIGRTPLTLFDANAANPFAVHAGMRIRFVAIPAERHEA